MILGYEEASARLTERGDPCCRRNEMVPRDTFVSPWVPSVHFNEPPLKGGVVASVCLKVFEELLKSPSEFK